MKYLMLHSAPKMLLHILPPPPVAGDYTSDASSSQEGFSSSANGNNTSNNSFPNSTIHQVDVAERQLLVSTTEPRVYLYSLDDEGRLFPLGGAKTAAAATGSSASSTLTITTTTSNGHKKGKKSSHFQKTESSSSVNHCSGVTALATYCLLKLTTFGNSSQHQQSSVLNEDNSSSNDSSGDFESPSNPANGFYNRPSTFQSASSRLPPPQLSSAPVKLENDTLITKLAIGHRPTTTKAPKVADWAQLLPPVPKLSELLKQLKYSGEKPAPTTFF